MTQPKLRRPRNRAGAVASSIMPTACPSCGGKWPYGAIMCTACGFDPAIHKHPQAMARAEAEAKAAVPRGRFWWIKTDWFLAVLPNLIIPPLAMFRPNEPGRARENYDLFMVGVILVCGGAIFIAAAINAYQRTRDGDHGLIRPRLFAGVVTYASLRYKLAILGFLVSVFISKWLMERPRLD